MRNRGEPGLVRGNGRSTEPSLGSRRGSDEGRPYRGLSPEARRSERRRRLLDAGLQLFGTNGYANTSIEQICSMASVTTRHFYEEYGCREELLKSTYTEIVMSASRAVSEAVESAAFFLEARIRAGITAYLHTMLDDARKARIFCVEVVGVSPEMEAHRRAVVHLMAGMTQYYADQLRVSEAVGFPEGLNFTFTTLHLVGGTNELMVEWMMGGQRVPLDDLIEDVVRIYLTVGSPLLGYTPEVAGGITIS